MNLINFDEQFQRYTTDWMQENAAKYGNNLDRMEAMMPEVYLQWLNMPALWLDGKTPGAYFEQYDDARMLVEWMCAYFSGDVPVPDQLLERIEDIGPQGEEALYALLQDEACPEEATLTAITLLAEMESVKPLALYVDWVAAAQDDTDERAEKAAEALSVMGREVVPPALAAIQRATPHGREVFLDVLCNYPGEEAIYTLALSLFEENPHKRALFASLLGKLGDERAIAPLLRAMEEPELGYLDYVEMRNAVEALGGDAPMERMFDGDPYYESLRRME